MNLLLQQSLFKKMRQEKFLQFPIKENYINRSFVFFEYDLSETKKME
jgi:hypothetical protein